MVIIRVGENPIDVIEDVLLGGKYHYVHDEFAGELLSNLWVTNGTGQNNGSTFATCGAWSISTLDSPTANDLYCLYGKQEFIFDKVGTILTLRGLIGHLTDNRACFGVNNPHGDVSYDWYNVGTSLASALFFEYNSTISSNWLARVIDGTTDWTADTGVPAVANTMFDFRIERTADANIQFKINDSVVANYTTELVNDTNLSIALFIQTFTTTKRFITIDFINYLRPKD